MVRFRTTDLKFSIHTFISDWLLPYSSCIHLNLFCLFFNGEGGFCAQKNKKWLLLLLSHFSLCSTLCDPIDSSPPGSPVLGIPQARTLEWVAISFSNAWKWKVKVKSLSRVRLLATPWTAAHQALPSMGFSSQEYWSGVPLPSLANIRFLPQLQWHHVGSLKLTIMGVLTQWK